MSYTSIFKRKKSYIKSRYGIEASVYFSSHPHCERCPEDRFACLTLHHTKGKKIKEFEVLCFNCHMLEHARNSGESTFRQELVFQEEREDKTAKIKLRNEKIINRLREGKSLRIIGREYGVSSTAIYLIGKTAGVVNGRKNQYR
jgi:hypothetical protein